MQSGHIRKQTALGLIRQSEPKCPLPVMRTLCHSLGPQQSVAEHDRKVQGKACSVKAKGNRQQMMNEALKASCDIFAVV